MGERAGATLRFGEIARWEKDGDGVRVRTDGATYRADRLVLTAGAWMTSLLPDLSSYLWVERNVLFWFEPLRRTDEFARLPVWILQDDDRNYYGFPYDAANGFKLAGLHFGDRVDPNTVDREARESDEERVRKFVRKRLPEADGERRLAKVCMYTNARDGHFVIDRADPSVVFASACSGHGFKFASAIGELLADMATTSTSAIPLFSASRVAATARP
jgi:sarcosine oxidase